jgi:hypothetical protein
MRKVVGIVGITTSAWCLGLTDVSAQYRSPVFQPQIVQGVRPAPPMPRPYFSVPGAYVGAGIGGAVAGGGAAVVTKNPYIVNGAGSVGGSIGYNVGGQTPYAVQRNMYLQQYGNRYYFPGMQPKTTTPAYILPPRE